MTETLLYLALHLAASRPPPELDEALRPKWLFGRTVRESCNRAGFSEQVNSPRNMGPITAAGQARLQGPGGEVQRAVRGW